MRHRISADPIGPVQIDSASPARTARLFHDFSKPAPVALPGSRSRRSGAGGQLLQGACPGSSDTAARGRPTSSVSSVPAAQQPRNREETA